MNWIVLVEEDGRGWLKWSLCYCSVAFSMEPWRTSTKHTPSSLFSFFRMHCCQTRSSSANGETLKINNKQWHGATYEWRRGKRRGHDSVACTTPLIGTKKKGESLRNVFSFLRGYDETAANLLLFFGGVLDSSLHFFPFFGFFHKSQQTIWWLFSFVFFSRLFLLRKALFFYLLGSNHGSCVK